MRTGSIFLTVFWIAGGLLGQSPSPANDPQDVDSAVAGLRQISKDLTETVRRFNSHLDEAVSKFDHGYRSADGSHVAGADADLTSPTEIVQTALRKGMAFRMLAARSDRYEGAALADLDRIQALIAETGRRVTDATTLFRRLDVVSAGDISARSVADAKTRRDHLLRARSVAQQAAADAEASLPVEAPEPDAPDRGSLAGFTPLDNFNGHPIAPKTSPVTAASTSKLSLPLRIDHRKRVTFVKENYCRVALTDSGVDDNAGRRIFYEEEWIQRGDVVIRRRWRVAVDPATGQHVLVKRYPLLEVPGFLADVYKPIERNHMWYVEPPDGTAEPSREDVNRALSEVTESRRAVENAAAEFNRTIHDLMSRQDQERLAGNLMPLDIGLPDSFREALFAIRADLGRVPAVLEAKRKVRQSVGSAERSVDVLEPLAAWANRVGENAEWDQILKRADREIDLLGAAEKTAVSALPPDASSPTAEFPALAKNAIVRIRTLPPADSHGEVVRCLQEIWLLETTLPGAFRVRRTAALVTVDPRTGAQNLTTAKTIYYQTTAGEALEEVFDENAADDILLKVKS